MTKQTTWVRRLAWLIPLTICTVGVVIACSDRPLVAPQRGIFDSPRRLATRHAYSRVQKELHDRNPYSWVGAAHNQMIDDFRAELRKPGVLTNDVCGYLESFASAHAQSSAEGKAHGTPSPATVRAALKRFSLCGDMRGHMTARAISFEMPTLSDPSPAAADLLSQVGSAIDVATSPSDLAARLLPILDAAGGLASPEHEAVAAVISVAQQSAEYWDANLTAAITDVQAEYSPCAQYYFDLGFTSLDAKASCLTNASSIEPSAAPAPRSTAGVRFASLPFDSLNCTAVLDGGSQMGNLGRDVLKTDAKGAGVGAFAGLFTPIGPLVGAVAGGGGASIGEMVGQAFDLWWCLTVRGGSTPRTAQK